MNADATSRYLKKLFFLAFVTAGFIAPFATLFFKHTLTGPNGEPANHLIGWIYFFMPLVGLLANIPAGILADRLHLGRHLLSIFCFGAAVITLTLGLAGSLFLIDLPLSARFAGVFVLVLLFAIFNMPIVPTLDAETMSTLAAHGARRTEYGAIRLYGTLGWSVACIIMGVVLYAFDHLPLIYLTASAFYLMLALASRAGISARKRLAPINIPWHHLRQDRPFMLFLLFSLLNGAVFAASFLYTSYFFEDVLNSPLEMGLVFGTWTIFEIPLMKYGKPILERLGNRWLMVFGLLANGVRLLLFSLFTLETPFAAKWAAATLQGAAFGAVHLATIDFVDRQSHHQMKNTYMNLTNVARFALASAVGGKVGAVIIEQAGSDALMGWCGIASLGLIVFFLLAVKGHSPKDDPAETA